MVNMFNRRLAVKDQKETGLMGGIVAVVPPNHLGMLTDYIAPEAPHWSVMRNVLRWVN
jgi:hypothetical protein